MSKHKAFVLTDSPPNLGDEDRVTKFHWSRGGGGYIIMTTSSGRVIDMEVDTGEDRKTMSCVGKHCVEKDRHTTSHDSHRV